MLKNYLKIALRNLRRNKSYTFINFLGLTMGMTCCVLIALYVKSELSFDDFNKKINRIVAVGSKNRAFGKMLATPYPLAKALVDEAPQVDKAIPIVSINDLHLSRNNNHFLNIQFGQYTQSAFFDIFSFNLLQGNKNQALSAPNSIVLTKKSAKRLFGGKQAVGQTLYWQRRDTTQLLNVTGIVSNPPINSSIKFNALLSLNTRGTGLRSPSAWKSYMYHTFALMNKNTLSLIMNKNH